jgi:hypothetical protein
VESLERRRHPCPADRHASGRGSTPAVTCPDGVGAIFCGTAPPACSKARCSSVSPTAPWRSAPREPLADEQTASCSICPRHAARAGLGCCSFPSGSAIKAQSVRP